MIEVIIIYYAVSYLIGFLLIVFTNAFDCPVIKGNLNVTLFGFTLLLGLFGLVITGSATLGWLMAEKGFFDRCYKRLKKRK